MSTPFPFEEEGQTDNLRPTWNPWKGPADPHWYSGMGFNDESHYLGPFGRALDAAGAGAAKGEAVLGGLIHQNVAVDTQNKGALSLTDADRATAASEQEAMNTASDAIRADAKMRVQALTPNSSTTGAAVQLLHGIVSGGTEMAIGGLAGGVTGAAALVGSAEGVQRYNELIDAGVDPDTARKSALLAGGTSAAGALVPGGVGSTLASKITSGSVGNTIFGIANRYADHKILESAGYPEMAAQQKIIDGTQVITDLILGAGFGGLAHLHSPEVVALRNAPGAREAALTANLAIKDRESAPGIPADPGAANAHQSAHETSIADLMQGKQVDVSDSGVTEAKFVERPDVRDPVIEEQVKSAIKESGLFGEDNERDVQALLEGREFNNAPPESEKSVAHAVEPGAEAEAEGYSVGEEEMSDELRQKFEGLRSDVPADEKPGTVGQGKSEGQLPGRSARGAAGGAEAKGEPLPVHRGSDRPLSPEDFLSESFGHQTGRPSSGLGVFFTSDKAEAAGYGKVSTHHLEIKKPLEMKSYEVPPFDSIKEATAWREKQRAKGYDGLVIDASSVGGQTWYVPFEHEQVRPAGKARAPVAPPEESHVGEAASQAAAERPDFTIPDENGNPVSARDALAQAREEAATKRRESTIAANAAITCYMRRGN